jgi:hypothetical protein
MSHAVDVPTDVEKIAKKLARYELAGARFDPLWMGPFCGGEAVRYMKLLAETRAEARSRMIDTVREVGANWVLGLRYGSSETADDMSEIIAYRTAVRAVEIELGPADSDDAAAIDE